MTENIITEENNKNYKFIEIKNKNKEIIDKTLVDEKHYEKLIKEYYIYHNIVWYIDLHIVYLLEYLKLLAVQPFLTFIILLLLVSV